MDAAADNDHHISHIKGKQMPTLLVYTSRHGCAEKCANKISDLMDADIQVVNIKESSKFKLSDFDTIILGGSIHAGQVQKKVKKYCHEHLNELKSKRLGLFLCCMEEGEKAEQQFNNAFPDELIQHAAAKGLFGGEFDFEKMNFIERAITRKVAKIEKSISKIDEAAIEKFVIDLRS